jgi:alpha-beta hydrolase superfamily lysophospholipase
VQIVHGIGEHSGRYNRFARALADHGFAVFAEDHRGHGKTAHAQTQDDPRRKVEFGQLGPGGLRGTEDAIAQLVQQIRGRFPNCKVGVFAHSWGSLMVQRMIQRYRYWDAVALSGTAYRTARYMESGDLNANFPGPTGHEWLSRDESVAREYTDDPLTYESNIREQFGWRDSLRLFGVPRRGVARDVPILIIGGGADALNRRDGRERLAAAYRRAGVREVSLKIYPGARHEMLRELNADEAIGDVTSWFEATLL